MDVVIIGAGPAGLSAATTLARAGADVLVLDREASGGGIPRHSAHLGYGRRDLHRFESGPAYARHLVERALDAGAALRTSTMVTDWTGPLSLAITAPTGRDGLTATAIVLATGARERPRAARMIPGDRPSGVVTTGQLQQLVAQGTPVGRRAVVIGAEAVSWSAVLTLRHAGVRTELLTTEYPTAPASAAFTLAGRVALRVPVATRTRVARIIGRDRVSAIELEDLRTGTRRRLECDTVVCTADWIPDHELARSHGIEVDPGTLGPLVDGAGRTSHPGVFAAGNVVHPVDTADRAALAGRSVAASVLAWLDGVRPPPAAVRLRPGDGLRWITPGWISPGSRGVSAWAERSIRRPTLRLEQDGRLLAERRLLRPVGPGRVLHLPSAAASEVATLAASADPGGGPVIATLLG